MAALTHPIPIPRAAHPPAQRAEGVESYPTLLSAPHQPWAQDRARGPDAYAECCRIIDGLSDDRLSSLGALHGLTAAEARRELKAFASRYPEGALRALSKAPSNASQPLRPAAPLARLAREVLSAVTVAGFVAAMCGLATVAGSLFERIP